MKAVDIVLPLHIGDYLGDTMHLRGAEHGPYLLLIMHYWRTGKLPDDDIVLAAIAKTDLDEWQSRTGPVVRAFFEARDKFLIHPGIDRRKQDAVERFEKSSTHGRNAANVRWGLNTSGDAEALPKGCPSNAQAMPEQCLPISLSKKERDTNVSPKKTAQAKGTRLTEDWRPDAADTKYAADMGLPVERIADDFRCYWVPLAGARAIKTNWSLTWQGWCRREADKRGLTPKPKDDRAPPPRFL